jgi:glycerol uptake facilitator-like aquaporin
MNFIQGIAEFLGTFIFISIILNTSDLGKYQPIAIGIGLIASLLFVGTISGGHLNPAITIMKLFGEKTIKSDQAILHITAQVLGGLTAWFVYKKFH